MNTSGLDLDSIGYLRKELQKLTTERTTRRAKAAGLLHGVGLTIAVVAYLFIGWWAILVYAGVVALLLPGVNAP